MISPHKTKVQEIKSRFENLSNSNCQDLQQLSKRRELLKTSVNKENCDKSTDCGQNTVVRESLNDDCVKPNSSYLYNKIEVKRSVSDTKNIVTRQCSDPGKKLHRSHAFRCDKSQKIERSSLRSSCHGRESISPKMEGKLSKDRLKKLGNFLEEQMKKENFVPERQNGIVGVVNRVGVDSIPNSEVPPHILDQYAMVVKPKKKESDRQDAMTDSGVSSETENGEEEKNRIKRLMLNFENTDTNLVSMDNLCESSETIKLERKNPHLLLTETLKKALKQPLPPGPPPQKPPRLFQNPVTEPTVPENPDLPESQLLPENPPEIVEKEKKDAKRMLEKLELVLKKREETTENTLKPKKEIHYLCTEILDITNRTLLPNHANSTINNINILQPNITSDPISKCLNSLNCAITANSMSSLPYTRFKTDKNCCSCSTDSVEVSQTDKCKKCTLNEHRGFKCHLNCECVVKNSEFYVNSEHIYDVPGLDESKENQYGTLNVLRNSKSMEELRIRKEDRIYDIPYEPRPHTIELPLQPSSPKISKTDFKKLRQCFEAGFPDKVVEKPLIQPKPMVLKDRKWVENGNGVKDKREKGDGENRGSKYTLQRRDTQLDIDRQNLNCLMNELSETVTAVCKMDDNKPTSFPTDSSDTSASEGSVKCTKSLTEQRKNYVRRVSTRVAYLDPKNIKRFRNQTSVCSYKTEDIDNPYSTFRSWKSFRTSQSNITKMETETSDVLDNSIDKSIDEKAGCIDISFEKREKGLFNMCLLVGLNYMTGQAYVKSVFPNQVPVPPHIENLVFPETMSEKTDWSVDAKSLQCYSLVLTDERGERAYGYCRRVLPEGAQTCLPLCYCLIGRYRAPGFYYKVLEEIESLHGSSDEEIHSLLQQLFESDFPSPGEEISIHYKCRKHSTCISNDQKTSPKCKTLPDLRHTDKPSESDYIDWENNNKSITLKWDTPRIKTIKRPLEPRIDEDNLSTLLDTLGAGLVIKVFGSLLLERKVIIVGDNLRLVEFRYRPAVNAAVAGRLVSSCIEALQSILYPFVWQQPLISSIPSEIQRDVLEAPLPILAGMLAQDTDITNVLFDEGMLIDLTHPSKVLIYHGDESTILPTSSYKLLKTSLHLETHKNNKNDDKTRNVMISEAFLRFFVDILGDFWGYFKVGELNGGLGRGNVVFDKESFIKNASTKQHQYCLEWFTETAMFTHFIQNMAVSYNNHKNHKQENLVDTPLPDYYELFHERVKSKIKSQNKNVEVKNYTKAVNKKVKFLKSKLRELVA